MAHPAPIVERFVLDDTRTVSTGSIRVYGIVMANTNASGSLTFQFTDADDTLFMQVKVTSGTTESIDISFLADNGLKVKLSSADADGIVSILRGQVGA